MCPSLDPTACQALCWEPTSQSSKTPALLGPCPGARMELEGRKGDNSAVVPAVENVRIRAGEYQDTG